MNNNDPFYEQKLNKIQLIIYLLPLIGWIPSLLTLNRRQSSSQQRSVSRLSVRITLFWLLAYGILWAGSAYSSDIFALRLLYANGLLTTGYILTCLGFILHLWQDKNNEQ